MIKKILPWLIALMYGVCPYDLVPDFFVGPGWLDDLVVLGIVYWWVSRQRKAYATRGTSSAGTEKTEEPPPRSDRTQEEDPYEILGLQLGASVGEIKAAHKKLAARYHPAIFGGGHPVHRNRPLPVTPLYSALSEERIPRGKITRVGPVGAD